MNFFTLEKIISKLTGRNSAATRRNLGGTNLELRQSCYSAEETSLREGEIITIVITNDPLIGRGSISINIFTSTISSQNLVHLLYSILVPKPQIGTCGRLKCWLHLVVDARWFIWWKITCSDPLCYLISLWSWAWMLFVSSCPCSWGHGRSHVASNHVNLIFIRYFDDMCVLIPLVVLCECRLHDTSPSLDLIMHCGVVIRWWVARVTEA